MRRLWYDLHRILGILELINVFRNPNRSKLCEHVCSMLEEYVRALLSPVKKFDNT